MWPHIAVEIAAGVLIWRIVYLGTSEGEKKK